MPKLNYRLIKSDVFSHREAFILSDVDDGGDDIEISLNTPHSGKMKIDDVYFPVVDGIAKIRAGALEDGFYYPTFISDKKRISVSPFCVDGRYVKRACLDVDELDILIELVCSLDEDMEQMRATFGTLVECILGPDLFKFEMPKEDL